MTTLPRMSRAGKTSVVVVAVVGLAGLAGADLIVTNPFPNGSFEVTALAPNTSQISTPGSWSFVSGDAASSSWMGNLQVDGTPITPHEGNQVAYLKPNQNKTDRIQVLSVTLTSDMFGPGQTAGTLEVSAWFQRWGSGTAGAYMHVYKNGTKFEPTADGGATSVPETDWTQLSWGGADKPVAVDDTLSVILWGYTFGASGDKQIIWDDITFSVTSIPEPGSLVLLGAGGALVLPLRRRRAHG